MLNNKAAKIHIGDRIPLIATTIQDVTGQVRNAYDYKEIGIRLSTEPTIHLDNSVTVKLGLEVSSLGQNLGTAGQPAYSIGSRNAETYMLLRDGETAILGGLIRDDERDTRVKIPGLGDIPVLGALFTSYDDSAGRTDVLLTITPHVVRGWEMQQQSDREFFSGTENTYSDKSVFASFNDLDDATASSKARVGTVAKVAGVPATLDLTDEGTNKFTEPVLLAFSKPNYEVKSGEEFEIELTGQNMLGVTSAPIELLYNPLVMNFVRAEAGKHSSPEGFNVVVDEANGLLSIKLDYPADAKPKKNAVTARVIMKGIAPGVSYLTYATQNVTGASGKNLAARSRASRVVIN